MPEVIQPKRSRRGLLVLTICGVVVVAIGVAVFMFQKVAHEKQAFDNALSQAKSLDHAAKYKESAAVLQTYLDTKPPKKYGDQIYLRLGSAYINASDYPHAIQMFKKAEAADAKNKQRVLQGLAQAYGALGDKAAAIDYYRQLIVIAELSGNNDAKMDVAAYNNSIHELEQAK
jgi:tetratricopeptide (TPR) repeat protein